MKSSALLILLCLLSHFSVSAQSAQAIMEVEVEVVSGFNGEILETKIGNPENEIPEDFDYPKFSSKTETLIEKEAILLYKINNRPNKKLLVRLDPVQKLKNNNDQEIIFIIHKVGYSHSSKKDSINYFDTIGCNEFKTNNEGEVYLWVDGHFFFSESMAGKFSNSLKFISLQCEEIES